MSGKVNNAAATSSAEASNRMSDVFAPGVRRYEIVNVPPMVDPISALVVIN